MSEKFRVVTVEEHFVDAEVVERVLELGGSPVPPDAGLGAFMREFLPDPDSAGQLSGRRLEHMDEVGIDVQVVSHGGNTPSALDHPEATDLCRRVNDALAEKVAEHPDRFRGFATVPLHDPEAAAEEMRRCVDELGFVGTLVQGSCGGRFLDDRRYDAVLSAAEEVDLPIYVHPGQPGSPVQSAYYAGSWPSAVQWLFAGPTFGWHAEAGVHVLRLILSGAFDRHPGLKLLSGHWGEFVAGWLDRVDETIRWAGDQAGLERLPSEYYRDHVWVTPAGLFSHHQLAYIKAELGAERIIHAEDFPYVVRDNVADFLLDADLDDAERQAIAHGNADALLRLP